MRRRQSLLHLPLIFSMAAETTSPTATSPLLLQQMNVDKIDLARVAPLTSHSLVHLFPSFVSSLFLPSLL